MPFKCKKKPNAYQTKITFWFVRWLNDTYFNYFQHVGMLESETDREKQYSKLLTRVSNAMQMKPYNVNKAILSLR